jgi:hypothetical protein
MEIMKTNNPSTAFCCLILKRDELDQVPAGQTETVAPEIASEKEQAG